MSTHCDVNNDETIEGEKSNYHYVIVLWRCFFTLPCGNIVWWSRIGYGRRSINDAIARRKRAEQLFKTQMKPWIKEQPYYKIHDQVDSQWLKEDFYERQGINVYDCGVKRVIAFPPMINKHAGTLLPLLMRLINLRENTA